MTNKQKNIGIVVLATAVLAVLLVVGSSQAAKYKVPQSEKNIEEARKKIVEANIRFGSAPPGLAVGTSSIELFPNASSTAGYFINASPYCASRVISTASSSIMLSFGSTTPSASRGHWQAASTTERYDAGLYGCGQWTVFGFPITGTAVTASTFSVTEFR